MKHDWLYVLLVTVLLTLCIILLTLFCCLLCRGLHEDFLKELTNRKKLENFLKHEHHRHGP